MKGSKRACLNISIETSNSTHLTLGTPPISPIPCDIRDSHRFSQCYVHIQSELEEKGNLEPKRAAVGCQATVGLVPVRIVGCLF